jgi:hypothetical protein
MIRVGRMHRDPDVHIGCGTRISMIVDRVAADEQILNLVRVE